MRGVGRPSIVSAPAHPVHLLSPHRATRATQARHRCPRMRPNRLAQAVPSLSERDVITAPASVRPTPRRVVVDGPNLYTQRQGRQQRRRSVTKRTDPPPTSEADTIFSLRDDEAGGAFKSTRDADDTRASTTKAAGRTRPRKATKAVRTTTTTTKAAARTRDRETTKQGRVRPVARRRRRPEVTRPPDAHAPTPDTRCPTPDARHPVPDALILDTANYKSHTVRLHLTNLGGGSFVVTTSGECRFVVPTKTCTKVQQRQQTPTTPPPSSVFSQTSRPPLFLPPPILRALFFMSLFVVS
jgi:hypothetical protein